MKWVYSTICGRQLGQLKSASTIENPLVSASCLSIWLHTLIRPAQDMTRITWSAESVRVPPGKEYVFEWSGVVSPRSGVLLVEDGLEAEAQRRLVAPIGQLILSVICGHNQHAP